MTRSSRQLASHSLTRETSKHYNTNNSTQDGAVVQGVRHDHAALKGKRVKHRANRAKPKAACLVSALILHVPILLLLDSVL